MGKAHLLVGEADHEIFLMPELLFLDQGFGVDIFRSGVEALGKNHQVLHQPNGLDTMLPDIEKDDFYRRLQMNPLTSHKTTVFLTHMGGRTNKLQNLDSV